MFLRIAVFVSLLFCFSGGSALAQEYTDVSWSNMIRTLLRFNALDISDDTLLDEYALISECELYTNFYGDDFKWNQIRKALQESIKMNTATFPVKYHFDATMRLERYDFKEKLFSFTDKTSLRGVNAMIIYSVDGTACTAANVQYMPRSFRAVLSVPLALGGLPLSESDAQALLARMTANKNSKRYIYARYNFRVVYVEPLQKIKGSDKDSKTMYRQPRANESKEIRLDVNLDSVGFYEDADRTKLIYLYTP